MCFCRITVIVIGSSDYLKSHSDLRNKDKVTKTYSALSHVSISCPCSYS